MAEARATWTDERLDDLSRRVEDGFSRIETRFDRLEARVDAQSDPIDGLHRAISQVGGASSPRS